MGVQKWHKMGLSVTYSYVTEPSYAWIQLLMEL